MTPSSPPRSVPPSSPLRSGQRSGQRLRTRSSRARAVLISLALASALVPLVPFTAHADPTPQQVKNAAEAFDKGAKAAQAGDLEGAAIHFENADREAPSDAALRAAIRARRDAKQPSRAATLAELALSRYGEKEEIATFAKSVVLQFGKELQRVEITCKPACELVADAKIVHGEALTKRVIYLEPGKHTVSAGWGPRSASKEVSGAAGASTSLSFTPPAEDKPAATPAAATSAPREEPKPEPKKGSGLPPAVFVTGAVITGVLAGVTIWSGLDTNSNPGKDKVREACVGQGESCPEYQDGLSKQKRTNVLIFTTAGVGVVTGVIGAFLTNWAGDGAATSTTGRVRAIPVVSVDGSSASIGAHGRFLASRDLASSSPIPTTWPLPSSSTSRPAGSASTATS